MTARPEDEFPTIRDLRDALADLINRGLGDHPVQVVIVPGSTMRSIARATNGKDADDGRPPLMIELVIDGATDRLPATFVSTDFLEGKKSTPVQ